MNTLQIERIVRRAGATLAEGLHFYWPTAGENELPEANVTVHMAAALLESGFIVNAEAQPQNAVTHIDLLGIHPYSKTLVAFEFKRLIGVDRVRGLQADVERILAFQPQKQPMCDPRLTIESRFGVAGGTTWNDAYATWWDSDDAQDPTRDGVLDEFAHYIPTQTSAWGTMALGSYTGEQSQRRLTQWFLYVVFPIE